MPGSPRARPPCPVVRRSPLVPPQPSISWFSQPEPTVLRSSEELGFHFPMQPAEGYHQDRDIGENTPALRHACVFGENLVFCAPMDGFVRFAGWSCPASIMKSVARGWNSSVALHSSICKA